MKEASAESIRKFILQHFGEKLADEGLSSADVQDDFDLLDTGLTDSLGIIDMITEIEVEFDLEIDYEDLDPDDMTVIGALSRFIESQSKSA